MRVKHSRFSPFSLRLQVALTIAAGVVLGVLVFYLTDMVLVSVTEKYLLSEEKTQERMVQYQRSFLDFVAANEVSSLDSVLINDWAEQTGDISILLYKENKLILSAGLSGQEVPSQAVAATEPVFDRQDENRPAPPGARDDGRRRPKPDEPPTEAPTEAPTEVSTEAPTALVYEVYTGDEEDLVYEDNAALDALEELLLAQGSGFFRVEFADGTAVANINDNRANRIEAWKLIADIVAAFLVFSAVILVYNGRKTDDVIRLAKTVREVGGGDLNKEIAARGNDEIALLAHDVDAMRRSLVEKMNNEKKALSANNELITAMSHDIRTPLTALIGYLDILGEHRFENEAQRERYLTACRGKAQQLKELSDRLFHYFLVFGQQVAPLQPEEMDAQLFLSQVLGEHMQYLLELGFSVQYEMLQTTATVYLDGNEISRVFDNIFSNITRYADRSAPVLITTHEEEKMLLVRIENRINPNAPRSESTGFGLKICRRILEQTGGQFNEIVTDETYHVLVKLPVSYS